MAHHTETLMNRNLQETHIIGCRNVKLTISGHLQTCKEVELYKDFEKTKCLRDQVNQISAQQGTTPKEGRGSADFPWIRNALFANQQKTTKKIL